MGTFNLLESVRQAHISAPLIYSSTNKVYGELKELRVVRNNVRYSYESLPYGVSEDQNLDFHTPYGCQKALRISTLSITAASTATRQSSSDSLASMATASLDWKTGGGWPGS